MTSEVLASNVNVFDDAIEAMKGDESHSRFIRFTVYAGPDSVLRRRRSSSQRVGDERGLGELQQQQMTGEGETMGGDESVVTVGSRESEAEQKEGKEEGGEGEGEGKEASHNRDILHMEAQGIMVYSRSADKPDHVRIP